jgi:membrane associated rhomboid family serine protease
MLFFPYRADHEINKIPIITIMICLICIGIYFQQDKNIKDLNQTIDGFCGAQQSEIFRLSLISIYGSSSPKMCVKFILGMHTAKNQDNFLKDTIRKSRTLAGFSRTNSDQYLDGVLRDNYTDFEIIAPKFLSNKLAYAPESWNPINMITAAFAHGSWDHVVGNLIFLFAFAVTVEAILGYLYFPITIAAIALLSHIFYSVTMLTVTEPPPTLGLSGVVSGIMAMFVFFLPNTRIRCFFWFFIIVKRFSVSAWLFVAFFVGWDIYYLFTDDGSSKINFAAHVGGAVAGYLLGLLLFHKQKRDIYI